MREPLALAALFMALGAATWSAWEPAPVACAGLALGCSVLAVLLRRWSGGAAAWVLGAALIGAASAGAVPRPGPAAEEERMIGIITRSSGNSALVQTAEGARVWRFFEPAPPQGTRIAAWTTRAGAFNRLPGSWPSEAANRLAGRPEMRVRDHLTLGTPPPPHRLEGARHEGLLLALATGRKDLLPDEERALLRRTGTTHLLAVSGLHIALIASLARALLGVLLAPLAFSRHPRVLRALIGLGTLTAAVGYASFVGWPISAVRAVWMVSAAVAASSLGRSTHAWSALGLAGCATVLMDPTQIYEAAALLSFGAVAGILWVGPRITRWLPPDAPWLARWVVGALATTIGATAGTLPVTAWIFQELPPLSPLSNLVAVPLIGGVATPAALIALAVPGPVGALALRVGDGAIHLGLWAIAPLAGEPLHPALGPASALALALALPLRRHTGACLGLLLLGLGLRELPRGGLTIDFLSVGQGDAALLRWPDGRAWLIDGGPPSDAVLAWLRREGVSRLDAALLSHPDADHLGGMIPALDGLEVGGLWVPREAREDEATYAEILSRLRARGVPIHGPEDPLPGAWLFAPPGESDNDQGLVALVHYQGFTALFTGDIEADAERWLAPRTGPVDLVKVPHHGSRSSSTPALVAATRPALALISVGAGNPFGHPAPEVLARWPRTLRTDQDGTVRVWTDGRTPVIRAWRPGEGWRRLPWPTEGD